jgi:hypothetical protein
VKPTTRANRLTTLDGTGSINMARPIAFVDPAHAVETRGSLGLPGNLQVVANKTARLALTGIAGGQRVKENDTGNIYVLELVGGEATEANWSPDHIETFDQVTLLTGTFAEIETKNAGVDPMEIGELAVLTDIKALATRNPDNSLNIFGSGKIEGVAWVSPSGNDTTGAVGDIKRPFASGKAAQDAAAGTKLVVVGPGTYTDQLTWTYLGKNGVNWYFMPGARVDVELTLAHPVFGNADTPEGFIFGDGSTLQAAQTYTAMDYSVEGFGEFLISTPSSEKQVYIARFFHPDSFFRKLQGKLVSASGLQSGIAMLECPGMCIFDAITMISEGVGVSCPSALVKVDTATTSGYGFYLFSSGIIRARSIISTVGSAISLEGGDLMDAVVDECSGLIAVDSGYLATAKIRLSGVFRSTEANQPAVMGATDLFLKDAVLIAGATAANSITQVSNLYAYGAYANKPVSVTNAMAGAVVVDADVTW